MICPKCGREQIKPSKFCTYCGAQMDMNKIENEPVNETNETTGKHSSRRTASHSVHKAASTAAKAGAVGLTTKIAIGAAGVCLAAGVGAVGLHMGHNWGAGKAVVAEKENGEDKDENSTGAIDETQDESAVDFTEESTESVEALQVKETNRKAVAAYRKYLADRMNLPDDPDSGEGSLGEFCLVDLNQDGIFELFADNQNTATVNAFRRNLFLHYNDSLKDEPIAGDYVMYNFQNQKIISWLEKGCIIVTSYQYTGDALTELGEWSIIANTHLITEKEMLDQIEQAVNTSGNEGYTGKFVPVTNENLDKYLSLDGMPTGNGEIKYLKEDLFEPVKEGWYDEKKELDEEAAQKAAFIAPYKAQLDAILAGTFEYSEDCVGTYSMNVKDAYESNIGIGVSWDSIEDKGDYYILKNAELYYTPESASYGDIATLPELYVRKDGSYQYHDGYNRNSVTLQAFLSKYPYSKARWGVKFDEQGFIVSWWDGDVA